MSRGSVVFPVRHLIDTLPVEQSRVVAACIKLVDLLNHKNIILYL